MSRDAEKNLTPGPSPQAERGGPQGRGEVADPIPAGHARVRLRPGPLDLFIDSQTHLHVPREPQIVPSERVGYDTRSCLQVRIEE